MKQKIEIFCERVRDLRGNRSQDEFAAFLGISRQALGFYENGNRIPPADTLLQVAQRCDVSTDWLLGLEDSPRHDLADIMTITGLTESGAFALRKLMHETEDLPGVLSDLLETRSFRDILRGCSELKQTACSAADQPWSNYEIEEYVNEEIKRLGVLDRAKEDLQIDRVPAIHVCSERDFFDLQRSRIVEDFSFVLGMLIDEWARKGDG